MKNGNPMIPAPDCRYCTYPSAWPGGWVVVGLKCVGFLVTHRRLAGGKDITVSRLLAAH
jgi:hypothetical protein